MSESVNITAANAMTNSTDSLASAKRKAKSRAGVYATFLRFETNHDISEHVHT
jgi:hypothetical protein